MYIYIYIYIYIYVCVCNIFIITDPTDLCCAFRTLVRAHRKRRSTAGHGGFYVIFASVRRVSWHHGVGWGGAVMTFLWTWSRCWCYATHWGGVGWGASSDDVPLDLITLLMLRHALGWGGVGWGQWWRSFGLDHGVDATPRIGVGWGGVGWGSDDVPLDLITVLMLRHALGWGGVGWGQWWRSFGLDHVVGFHNQICTQNIYIYIYSYICLYLYVYIYIHMDTYAYRYIDVVTCRDVKIFAENGIEFAAVRNVVVSSLLVTFWESKDSESTTSFHETEPGFGSQTYSTRGQICRGVNGRVNVNHEQYFECTVFEYEQLNMTILEQTALSKIMWPLIWKEFLRFRRLNLVIKSICQNYWWLNCW